MKIPLLSRERIDARSLKPVPSLSPDSAASCIQLVKQYGADDTTVRALDDVTIQFATGRLTAIMGPSGSGKSTLMHCAAGLDIPTSGRVLIGDIDITAMNERQRGTVRRDHVGFIFQAFNLVPTLTAHENIMLPLVLGGREADPHWFDQVVDTVNLTHRLDHRPSELSGGQQQRVAVARALVSRPKVIFADEPTGNLDSRTAAEILGFLRRSVDEIGQTIVMVTHDPVAASYAHRVVFLADGQIADQFDSPTADAVLDRMRRFAR